MWLTSDYPWAEAPTVGVFHRSSARALVRAGVGVSVVAPTPFAPPPLSLLRERWRLHARSPRFASDAGVIITRPRYLAMPGEPGWAQVDRLMADAVLRARPRAWPAADLIHAHYAAPMAMSARRLSRRTGLPYVVTLHGGDVTIWPRRHRDQLPAYRAALRGAARIIAVSEELAHEAGNLADVEALVVPIGIELERFTQPQDRDAARADLGIAAGEIAMVMVARLVPRKRVRELVDAMHLLGAPYRAVIAGDGPEDGYRAQPGLVDYIGPRSNDEVPPLLAAADVTVLASEREGMPTSLIEAGAAGVPVIASMAGGIPQLLADDRGVLVDPVTPETLADALRAFAADRAAALRRAERLRVHVLAEYDVDGSAARLVALYQEAVDGARRA